MDVRIVDGGNGGGAGSSCNCCSKLIRIGCTLSSLVVRRGGWGYGFGVAGARHGCVVSIFNVAIEDRIDAFSNGIMDGLV